MADLSLTLASEVIEAIAQRTAEIVLARLDGQCGRESASLFLTVPEAAAVLRSKRQRVDDLLSSGRLSRVKDGSRTLIRREQLLAYLDNNDGRGSR
jgi:excisionase family DNA binding protein